MNTFRKYAVYVLVFAFVAFIFISGVGSCKNQGKQARVKTEGTTTYEPKFRKDGELWLISANTGDTLKSFNVEYANTPERIEYGMMYRRSMAHDMGMLFFMGDMQMRSFWMKNTYLALDIIYLNHRMEVVSIIKNAEPLNTTSLPSEGPAMYVLEVPGGTSDAIGLQKGDLALLRDLVPAS